MAYLVNRPAESYASFDKQVFTIVISQTAYTLSHSVVNENDIRLVVNNVVQEPGSGKAYTASGTTLTLSAALVNGTDEMYCVFLGRALQTINPPSGSVGTAQLASTSVTAAKLNNDIISGTTALASEPDDTDEFLVSDAGTLKRIDYSLIKGGGITMADAFRLSADANSGSNADVTSNWERVDDTSFGGIGTGLTESSGIFSFPSTGIYLIIWQAVFAVDSSDINAEYILRCTTDNSSYTDDGYAQAGNGSSSTHFQTPASSHIFVVTNTSTHKFKFKTGSMGGSTVLKGDTDHTQTGFSVIRLGDT